MSKRIETEEQYEQARSWLVKTAQELADPLNDMSPEKKKKVMAVYDRTAELMRQYQRGELVQMFPGLRDVYAKIGWEYVERDPREQPDDLPEPATESIEEQPPAVNLSDWLDE